MDYFAKRRQGFTLIELMIVLSIVAFLSMVSLPSFFRFLSKAKRTEAYMHLGSIYLAQKAYWAENGVYATALQGPNSLGWKPEGYTGGGSKERFYYTYGFSQGSEGQHYFTGKLGASSAALGTTKADAQSFIIAAAADIDGDGEDDVLTVNHQNNIQVVKDDLS
jgi:type IV pilus assembly protein PilA